MFIERALSNHTPVFLADYLYSSRLYRYVVVGSIVEAIEAHPQDSFSLPRVDRNIYFCLSRNVVRARGAQHTPMIDIFFCLEWLKKVKPSALNLSQALLFRKSGNQKKKKNKQTKNESCPEIVAKQHSRRQEQAKTSDRFCRRLAIKKKLNPGILSYEVLLTCPMINPVACSIPMINPVVCKLLNTFNSIGAFSAALSFCELPTLLN